MTQSTLVVTDLDGTLWDNTMQCHPATLEALHELIVRDDIELLVATGRRRTSARKGFGDNGFVLPSVLLNGAIGIDFAADEIFHQATFDVDSLTQLFETLQSFSLAPVAYLADTRAMAIEGVTTSVGHIEALGADLVWSSFAELATNANILGMSMLGIEYADVEPAIGALARLAGVEVAAFADHLYPPYSLMLGPENVTKELGIRAYLAHANLRPDRIVALGDGGNDLEMLAMADVALAVSGGDQRAIDLADQIIERPENGGWAAVLDYL